MSVTPFARPVRPAPPPAAPERVRLEDLPDVLTDADLRALLGLSHDQWERHITKWRLRKPGATLPPLIPLGIRSRRYAKADVIAWLRETPRTRRHL